MSTPLSKNFSRRWITSYGFLFVTYIIVIAACTLTKYFAGPQAYNNYLIFKYSFDNLIHHRDMYVAHPDLYVDLYKYSPGFSVLMLPFYYLPDLIGLLVWNLLNGLLLFLAVKKLPLADGQKQSILWIILPELITAILISQSNALTTALVLLTYIALHNEKATAGALSAALAAGIKIFGAMGGLFFFFFRRKHAFIFWGVLLFLISQTLPFLFISPAELKAQYVSWFHMLKEDQVDPVGLSAMHLISSVFSVHFNFLPFQLAGLVLTLLPLLLIRKYNDTVFQLRFVASILLAMVLFNHKAESPTFIIAVTGTAIWYILSRKRALEKSLLIFVLIFTCLSPTDLVPAFLKEHFFVKYSLKALPCLLIWIVLQWELLKSKPHNEKTQVIAQA
jgi:hypothetical protein